MAFSKSTTGFLFLPSSSLLLSNPHVLKNKLETFASSWVTFSIGIYQEWGITVCLRVVSSVQWSLGI